MFSGGAIVGASPLTAAPLGRTRVRTLTGGQSQTLGDEFFESDCLLNGYDLEYGVPWRERFASTRTRTPTTSWTASAMGRSSRSSTSARGHRQRRGAGAPPGRPAGQPASARLRGRCAPRARRDPGAGDPGRLTGDRPYRAGAPHSLRFTPGSRHDASPMCAKDGAPRGARSAPRPGPAPRVHALIPDWHTARPWHRWPLLDRRPPLVDARARAGHAQHVDGRRDRNDAPPLRGDRRLRREVPAGDGPLAKVPMGANGTETGGTSGSPNWPHTSTQTRRSVS